MSNTTNNTTLPANHVNYLELNTAKNGARYITYIVYTNEGERRACTFCPRTITTQAAAALWLARSLDLTIDLMHTSATTQVHSCISSVLLEEGVRCPYTKLNRLDYGVFTFDEMYQALRHVGERARNPYDYRLGKEAQRVMQDAYHLLSGIVPGTLRRLYTI